MLFLVTSRLKAAGYDVLTAMTGPDGLTKAQGERPDLIILDIMLPGLTGYEVCTILKRDARHCRMPIILFTAKAQEKDERAGMQCGADAYLRKPFKADEMLATIRSLMDASGAGAGVTP